MKAQLAVAAAAALALACTLAAGLDCDDIDKARKHCSEERPVTKGDWESCAETGEASPQLAQHKGCMMRRCGLVDADGDFLPEKFDEACAAFARCHADGAESDVTRYCDQCKSIMLGQKGEQLWTAAAGYMCKTIKEKKQS